MGINEIKKSGLLEMYVVGECSPAEVKIVEQAIRDHPELQQEIDGISKALESYAQMHRVEPSPGTKERILEKIRGNNTPPSSTTDVSGFTSWTKWFTGLLGIMTITLAGMYFAQQSQLSDLQDLYEAEQIRCDSIDSQNQRNFAVLQDLQNTNNRVLEFTATENYTNVALSLIHNNQSQKNYLQIKNLPVLSANQSYQLWSLKADGAPIPLTVFQGDEGAFVPVDFETGTTTYAITVEPFGGQDSPTLANLVGTVNV